MEVLSVLLGKIGPLQMTIIVAILLVPIAIIAAFVIWIYKRNKKK